MRAEFCIFESNAPGLKANFYEPYVDKPSCSCLFSCMISFWKEVFLSASASRSVLLCFFFFYLSCHACMCQLPGRQKGDIARCHWQREVNSDTAPAAIDKCLHASSWSECMRDITEHVGTHDQSVYYPGQKNRYSWEIHEVDLQLDHVISCDVERRFDIDATRGICASLVALQIEVNVAWISHDRTADQSHEYLSYNDFFGQGSRSTEIMQNNDLNLYLMNVSAVTIFLARVVVGVTMPTPACSPSIFWWTEVDNEPEKWKLGYTYPGIIALQLLLGNKLSRGGVP